MDIRDAVLEGIRRCCTPRCVILYGEKVTAEHHAVKSADFCIVLDRFNRSQLLQKLYLNIQTDIPVQFVLYSTEEWNVLVKNPNSYASRIQKKGTVLYGQTT